jgi:hypothetical protein
MQFEHGSLRSHFTFLAWQESHCMLGQLVKAVQGLTYGLNTTMCGPVFFRHCARLMQVQPQLEVEGRLFRDNSEASAVGGAL